MTADESSPSVGRRQALGGVVGVTTLLLPAAVAAASDDEGGGTATVGFAPAVDIVGAGSLGNETVQVDMAWAEGYTRFPVGTQRLSGTTGTLEPFDWVLTGTDTAGQPISSSGSSTGEVSTVFQSTQPSTTVTLRLTSTTFPADVRTFTHTR